MDNDTIKDLGLCPVCQKGHIVKGSLGRSEERRVGKECSEPCRSRWSPDH